MTIDDSTEAAFSGASDEVRERAGVEPRRTPRKDIPRTGPHLTYSEPSNCILHFASPAHEVRASFSTVIGLSLCPECSLDVVDTILANGESAKEILFKAKAGKWLR